MQKKNVLLMAHELSAVYISSFVTLQYISKSFHSSAIPISPFICSSLSPHSGSCQQLVLLKRWRKCKAPTSRRVWRCASALDVSLSFGRESEWTGLQCRSLCEWKIL
jgi:hypothetical protein